jgi:hypothetical protein
VLFTRSVRLPWFFAAAVALGAQVVFSLLTKAEIGALDGKPAGFLVGVCAAPRLGGAERRVASSPPQHSRSLRVPSQSKSNNHDHTKRMHSSRNAADSTIARMINQGVPNGERLVSYFNEDLNGWFVGNARDRRAR